MRHVGRWLAILILVCAPAVAVARDAGNAPDQVRAPGHDGVADDETAGSALPRWAGGVERQSRAQRAILVMLVTLITATLVLGIATIAQAFRETWAHRRRR